MFRQYKSGRIEKQIYLRYNKIYRKLVQTEMENNFKENLLEAGQDSKKKWKILKKEIKIHSSTNSIEEIRTNGHTVIGKKEIARNFIITERNTRELRNRQFIRQNNWKSNSRFCSGRPFFE